MQPELQDWAFRLCKQNMQVRGSLKCDPQGYSSRLSKLLSCFGSL